MLSALIRAAAIALAIPIVAAALDGLTIALAHVLRVAILIPARSALLPLLILVACLIGHCDPPSAPATWRTPRGRLSEREPAGTVENASDMPPRVPGRVAGALLPAG